LTADGRPDPRFAGRPLLVVSPGVPHRSRGASTVLFFHYIQGIAQTGGRVLHVLLIDGTNADPVARDEYRREMAVFPNVSIRVQQLSQLYRLERWTRKPSVDPLPAALIQEVSAFGPERIVCFDILCAAYARQFPVPAAALLVWLGDLNFQTFWYHAWYDWQERPFQIEGAKRLLLGWLAWRQWKQFYRRVLKGVGSIVVASQSSERAIGALDLTAKYLPYPWPVDERSSVPAAPPTQPSFVFFGSLSGLGSRSAFHTLLRDVYPALVRVWGPGGFRIVIAGSRQMPDWAARDIRNKPEIDYQGFVADLPALLSGAHAAVIPIDVPVGNRSRIITAMAHGAIVIAHRNTSLGNPHLESETNCLLADSPKEFARHMRFAVDGPRDVLAAIRRSAREAYCEHFSPTRAVMLLLDELARLAPAPQFSPA